MKSSTLRAAVAAAAMFACATTVAQSERQDDHEVAKANDIADHRAKLLQTAQTTLTELRADPGAAQLLSQAYGYAVFDTTKGGFIVTGAGGSGVAQRQGGRDPVFMHMGSGGLSLGAGIENYRLAILFEDQATYDRFIDGEWSFAGSAQAAAGGAGAGAVAKFENGVSVYHLSDKGLIAQVDLSGVRFWPSERLNTGPA